MQVDYRIALVRARHRLVRALAEKSDSPRMRLQQIAELVELFLRDVARLGDINCRSIPETIRHRNMLRQIAAIKLPARFHLRQQSGEQSDIAIRSNRKMQVGALCCFGAARVDDY